MRSAPLVENAPSFRYPGHRHRSEFSPPRGAPRRYPWRDRHETCLRPGTLRVHICRRVYFQAFPPSTCHRNDTLQFRQKLLAEHSRTRRPHAEIVGQRLSVDLGWLLITTGSDAPTEHAPGGCVGVGKEPEHGPGSIIGLRLLRETSARQSQIQLEIPRACARPYVRMLRAALQLRQHGIDRHIELVD